jgi:DNA-binding NarL/FixJ family response regulator
MSDELRVLIAEDHPVFRQGLRALLETTADIEVVGEAASGDGAVDQALELKPDVVLMDLRMPKLNGIEATRRIVDAEPQIGVLVLTMFEDDDSVFAAMRAGARGYLLKGSEQDEVLRAIRAVASGEAIFGPAIATRLIAYFSSTRAKAFPELTEREREVLELIAKGHNNQAIANELVLSLKTVRNHVSNVFNKLQVTDRAQAIVKAREAGLGRRSAEVEKLPTGARPVREPDRVVATVMFTDIVGSTERAAELGDSRWRELLARHETAVRAELERFRGQEIKMLGDGVLATFDGPARAIRCARAICEEAGALGAEIRAGLHTGECEMLDGDIGGIAVHTAARVSAEAAAGEVLVSSTVKDLAAGSGIEFRDRGVHRLKGVPGEWRLFAVES